MKTTKMMQKMKNPQKKGRFFLFGVFSEETSFALSHALRTCTSCTKHMLTEKKKICSARVEQTMTLWKEDFL